MFLHLESELEHRKSALGHNATTVHFDDLWFNPPQARQRNLSDTMNLSSELVNGALQFLISWSSTPHRLHLNCRLLDLLSELLLLEAVLVLDLSSCLLLKAESLSLEEALSIEASEFPSIITDSEDTGIKWRLLGKLQESEV